MLNCVFDQHTDVSSYCFYPVLNKGLLLLLLLCECVCVCVCGGNIYVYKSEILAIAHINISLINKSNYKKQTILSLLNFKRLLILLTKLMHFVIYGLPFQ